MKRLMRNLDNKQGEFSQLIKMLFKNAKSIFIINDVTMNQLFESVYFYQLKFRLQLRFKMVHTK